MIENCYTKQHLFLNAGCVFYGRHTYVVGQYKKNVWQTFADPVSENNLHFCGFAMANW